MPVESAGQRTLFIGSGLEVGGFEAGKHLRVAETLLDLGEISEIPLYGLMYGGIHGINAGLRIAHVRRMNQFVTKLQNHFEPGPNESISDYIKRIKNKPQIKGITDEMYKQISQDHARAFMKEMNMAYSAGKLDMEEDLPYGVGIFRVTADEMEYVLNGGDLGDVIKKSIDDMTTHELEQRYGHHAIGGGRDLREYLKELAEKGEVPMEELAGRDAQGIFLKVGRKTAQSYTDTNGFLIKLSDLDQYDPWGQPIQSQRQGRITEIYHAFWKDTELQKAVTELFERTPFESRETTNNSLRDVSNERKYDNDKYATKAERDAIDQMIDEYTDKNIPGGDIMKKNLKSNEAFWTDPEVFKPL